MNLRATLALLTLLLSLPCATLAFDEDEDTGPWQEKAVTLPPQPQAANLQSFYVSAATRNQFFIDTASLTVDEDGVVRYVLIVETAGGARNITYEGMRCESAEKRIYATGRHDGQWAKSRNGNWQRISNHPVNRQHAALFADHFCPGGVITRNRNTALDSLRHGPRNLDRITY
ncbi:MAG: CNP1-like family protein [Azonexus sp.]